MRRTPLLTTAIAAICVGVALLILRGHGFGTPLTARERLIAAWQRLHYRPNSARLQELGFLPRTPAPSGIDPSHDNAGSDTARLRTTADEVASACGEKRDGDPLCGVAYLLAGRRTAAVEQLTNRARAKNDPAAACDAAAAYLERGRARADPHDFVEALAWSDAALHMDPQNSCALFNRAVALETLGIGTRAQQAYRHYVAVDPTTGWADEARERARHKRIPRRGAWRDLVDKLGAARALTFPPATAAALVKAYPQESRISAEGELPWRWAQAEKAGDETTAQRWLTIARALGVALVTTRNEHLPTDAVYTIDTSGPDDRSRFVDAYLAYGSGRELYSGRKVSEALPLLTKAAALFRAGNNPMAMVADYFTANALIDLGRADAAIELWKRLASIVPQKYPSLRAEIAWVHATAVGQGGDFYGAFESYSYAMQEFARLGEQDYAQVMRSSVAGCYATFGDDLAAWRTEAEGLRQLSESGNDRLLVGALLAAAAGEIRRQRWDTAWSLLTVALEVAPSAAYPTGTAKALGLRALVAVRAHAADARGELSAARATALRLADVHLRDQALADLAVVESIVSDPPDRRRLLDSAIATYQKNGTMSSRPELYVSRGEADRALNDPKAAERDFNEAIRIIESGGTAIARDDLRDAYFGSTTAAYENLIDVLDGRGAVNEAFRVSERLHARLLLDRLAPPAKGSAALAHAAVDLARPPNGDTTLEYVVLGDRLLIFVIERGTVRRVAVPIGREALTSLAGRFAKAVLDADPATKTVASRLYDTLIAAALPALPARLTFVLDETLASVPVAALYDAAHSRFLMEESILAIAPGARWIAEIAARPHPPRPSALIVADSAFDATRFPGLSRLPDAATEARAISSLYPSAEVLTGDAATKQAVLSDLQRASVVHFATHAVVSAVEPLASSLLLTPSGGDAGTLSIREVMALRRAQLETVVLAGCSTAEHERRFGNVRSLVDGFLAAGARTAVGTLWDLDDDVGLSISRDLHAQLAKGVGAAEALRIVQIAMLRGPSANLRRPANWAAIEVFGSGH